MSLDSLTCGICMEPYTVDVSPVDRRPKIVCSNGHSLCAFCIARLSECSLCREALLPTPLLNRALMEVIDSLTNKLANIPQIALAELDMNDVPFAQGAYSDVFDASWHSQPVVVKQLRVQPASAHMKQLRLETSLAISLHHPNIVKVFGSVQLPRAQYGIVMEKADGGSLQNAMADMRDAHKVRAALGIVDGLDYLHSKKIAHRDLKPDNILLFGSAPTAKISDFGTSKVIQTIITNTSMAGTPKYVAPELLQPKKVRYGCSVDVYSLAIILYEVFSNEDAFAECTTLMEIMFAAAQGQRPSIPACVDKSLADLIEKGWSSNAAERPRLDAFRRALKAMPLAERAAPVAAKQAMTTSEVSAKQLTAETGKAVQPVPLISLNWNAACEQDDSAQLRRQMVHDVQHKSNMSRLIIAALLRALEVVPRHLFVDESRLGAFGAPKSNKLQLAYAYDRPIPATAHSNESSPEIIGTQLSLVKIVPGSNVVLVGIKGGYIQSLVAQIIGVSGRLATVSSNKALLAVCAERVQQHCPLKDVMRWVLVPNANDADAVMSALGGGRQFDAVIYCGAVHALPTAMAACLVHGGSLLAPVKVNADTQQLQLLVQHPNGQDIRKITDFGVIFEDVK